MGAEALAVLYGLFSAISWGTGDFSGGIATRRSHVITVIILSQIVGIALLVVLALLFGEMVPRWRSLLIGATAGVVGAIGLAALYKGLATGRMGLVAPVAAVTTAAIPLLYSLVVEGWPTALQASGFGSALLAIWLLSRPEQGKAVDWSELGLAVFAGLSFGLFLTLINLVSEVAILWPLVSARVASISILLALSLATSHRLNKPDGKLLQLIALAGFFDAAGNGFFALATRLGRLDVSAVLASLYPAATVLLAWLILKEKLERRHWLGLLMALLALILISS